MSEKKFNQQRNDTKHRKLIRSSENLSPCDLEPSLNSSSLSITTNIFAATQINNHSSPTKNYNDPLHQQQLPSTNLSTNVELPSFSNSSLPPSSSTPSIALYRKPSITIKYSKDEECKTDLSSRYQSSIICHQNISKSIDSNHPFSKILSNTENADQASNNCLFNVNSKIPGFLRNNVKFSTSKHQQSVQKQPKNTFNFNDEFKSSSITLTRDIYEMNQQQQIFAHSPTSQSLNLNFMDQSNIEQNSFDGFNCGQIVFKSNNPFLNDTFDAVTTHEDEGGGKLHETFYKQESEKMIDEMAIDNDGDLMEHQLLKNKREKFSNASTTKICLVVSPPTNKLFQVSNIYIRKVSVIR